MNKMQKMFCGAAMLVLSAPGLVVSACAEPAPGMNSSSGIIALNSLPNPPVTLATASVTDAKGMAVGFVEKVVMDAGGRPQTVDVSLMGSNAVVAVDASKFNYDQGLNILMTALDAQQIAEQPRAPLG
jgi:hypothetical protein